MPSKKIKCDACGTVYNVDESKIPDRIIRVKCKKCKNIITIDGQTIKVKTNGLDEEQKKRDLSFKKHEPIKGLKKNIKKKYWDTSGNFWKYFCVGVAVAVAVVLVVGLVLLISSGSDDRPNKENLSPAEAVKDLSPAEEVIKLITLLESTKQLASQCANAIKFKQNYVQICTKYFVLNNEINKKQCELERNEQYIEWKSQFKEMSWGELKGYLTSGQVDPGNPHFLWLTHGTIEVAFSGLYKDPDYKRLIEANQPCQYNKCEECK